MMPAHLPPRPAMRLAAAALASLLLGGCIITGKNPVTIYSPLVQVAAEPAWPRVDWSLSIASATATRMLESTRIAVRPQPGELQVYRNAIWSQPAPVLIEDAVLRTLEDSGRIDGIARQASGIRADYKLVLDIRRFEADYLAPGLDGGAPAAVIEVNAKLLDARSQEVAASRTFLQSQAAAGTATAQVVAAFEQGLKTVTTDIAGWTLQAVPARHIPPP